MNVIMLHYLISLVVSEKFNMQLMDVITVKLYGDLDTKIYMKVPERLKLTDSNNSRPRNTLESFEAFTIWLEIIRTDVV